MREDPIEWLFANKVEFNDYDYGDCRRLDGRIDIDGKTYGIGILHHPPEISPQELLYMMYKSFRKCINRLASKAANDRNS